MKKMIAMFLVAAATVATASALLDLVDWFAGNRVVQIGSLISVVVTVVAGAVAGYVIVGMVAE